METKSRIYKDGCIWINAGLFIHMDDIDFDHSYTRTLDNGKDTETISHHYSEEQQKQIIDHLRYAVSHYFNGSKKFLLDTAKLKVGSGNRIESYEN
jgi:hypothetical protein